MTRRAHGEGTIRRRGPNLWEARYIAADGRRRSLYRKTRREVVDALRDALRDAQHGILPAGQQMTVAEWLDTWLGSITVRPGTHRSYADTAKHYIVPSIGRVRLARLQPEHVSRMVRDIQRTHPRLSATTVRYTVTVLRIALGRAVRTGRIYRNVATLIDLPPKDRREIVPMSVAEARAFLSHVAGTRHEALYRLAITSGLRQGELLALRWSDIDMDAGTVSVRHTLSPQGTLAAPKTKRSTRTIDVEEGTIAVLRAHRLRQATERLAAGPRWDDRGHVFASAVGTPLDARNVLRGYHRDLAAAGLPHYRFHDLRHAFATMLIEDGVDVAVVSKMMGHASAGFTADTYAHWTPTMSRTAATRMRDILAG